MNIIMYYHNEIEMVISCKIRLMIIMGYAYILRCCETVTLSKMAALLVLLHYFLPNISTFTQKLRKFRTFYLILETKQYGVH